MTGRLIRASVVAALAGWFLLTTAGDSRRHSATVDEPRHLAGGWTYWRLADYRIHPENGVLTQRWLALPFFALRPALPPTDDQEFRKPSPLSMRFAHQFLHRTGNDPDRLLSAARTMNALLGLALAVATSFAARWAWRGASGVLAIALVCLCPNVVAHAGVATSDVAAALGFLLAVWTWARLLERLTPGRILCGGASWGLLAGFKMSAALIAPISVLAALPLLLARRPWPWRIGDHFGAIRTRLAKAGALLGLLTLHAAIAGAMLWSYYGFRYSAFASYEPALDGFTEPWEQILDGLGPSGTAIQFARDHRLLPEAYLYGVSHALKHAQRWPAYLNGRTSPTGWWYYFPLVFLMKTPLPTLALLLLAAWSEARSLIAPATFRQRTIRTRTFLRVWPFAALVVLYALVACRSNLNIGYRHLLPVLPPLFVLATGLERAGRPVRFAARLLVAWLAVGNVATRPHYLSYFNALAGGRDQGYRRLADSNVDWGQDLPAFAEWLQRLRDSGDRSNVYLLYFGEDDPRRFGINIPEPFADAAAGGWYCVSATAFVAPSRSGPWGDAQEREYQDLLTRPREQVAADAELSRRLRLARQLRLMNALAARTPDANIGGSILAFKLDEADVERFLTGPPPRRR